MPNTPMTLDNQLEQQKRQQDLVVERRGAQLLRPFLSKFDLYDKDGRPWIDDSDDPEKAAERSKNYAINLKTCLRDAGYDTSDGAVTALVLLVALGTLKIDPNNREANINDLLNPDALAKDKAEIGDNLYHITGRPINSQNTKELDRLFIKGTLRLNEHVEKLAREFARTGDISLLLQPRNALLCRVARDAMDSNYYNISYTGNNFLARNTGPTADGTLAPAGEAEKQLGGRGMEAFTETFSFVSFAAGLSSAAADLTEYTATGNSKASIKLLKAAAVQQFTRQRVQERYKKNPNASMSELFPTRTERKANEMRKAAPLDFSDDKAAEDFISALNMDKPPELDENAPGNAFRIFRQKLENDPFLMTGAAMLAMQGKLFKNIQYKMIPGMTDAQLTDFTFEPASDDELRLAAYKSGVPAEAPVDFSSMGKSCYSIEKGLNQLSENDRQSFAPLYDLIETLRGYSAKAPTGYGELLLARENMEKAQKQIARLQEELKDKRAYEHLIAVSNDSAHPHNVLERDLGEKSVTDAEKDLEMLRGITDGVEEAQKALSDLQASALERCTHMEQGVRQPDRQADFNDPTVILGRAEEMGKLAEQLGKLETSGMSSQWLTMHHALNIALKESKEIRDAFEASQKNGQEMDTDRNLYRLNNAMDYLQQAAHAYVQHKLPEKSLLKGKDLQRLQLAMRLEDSAARELKQVTPLYEHSLAQRMASNGGIYSQKWAQNMMKSFDMAVNSLDSTRRKTGSSRELKELVNNLDRMRQQLAIAGNDAKGVSEFSRDVLKRYFKSAKDSVDAYLEHKERRNDGSADSMNRIRMAIEIRDYMQVMELAMENPQLAAQPAKAEEPEVQEVQQKAPNLQEGQEVQPKEPKAEEKNEPAQPEELDPDIVDINVTAFNDCCDVAIEGGRSILGIASGIELTDVMAQTVSRACYARYVQYCYQSAGKAVAANNDTPLDREIIQAVKSGKGMDYVDKLMKEDIGLMLKYSPKNVKPEKAEILLTGDKQGAERKANDAKYVTAKEMLEHIYNDSRKPPVDTLETIQAKFSKAVKDANELAAADSQLSEADWQKKNGAEAHRLVFTIYAGLNHIANRKVKRAPTDRVERLCRMTEKKGLEEYARTLMGSDTGAKEKLSHPDRDLLKRMADKNAVMDIIAEIHTINAAADAKKQADGKAAENKPIEKAPEQLKVPNVGGMQLG